MSGRLLGDDHPGPSVLHPVKVRGFVPQTARSSQASDTGRWALGSSSPARWGSSPVVRKHLRQHRAPWCWGTRSARAGGEVGEEAPRMWAREGVPFCPQHSRTRTGWGAP